MIAEIEIQTNKWYKTKEGGMIIALTWEDGPQGVKYKIQNLTSFLPLFTSKEKFLSWIDGVE